MAYTRPATEQDAIELAPRLRAADLNELAVTTGHSGLEALTIGLTGTECHAIIGDDEQVVGMYGIHHHPECGPHQAVIWLLASDELVTIKDQFIEGTSERLKLFHQRYPLLWNLIDSRQVASIRWLKKIGFQFIKKYEHPKGVLYEFVRIESP